MGRVIRRVAHGGGGWGESPVGGGLRGAGRWIGVRGQTCFWSGETVPKVGLRCSFPLAHAFRSVGFLQRLYMYL